MFKGKPNGYDKGTPNYKFWEEIERDCNLINKNIGYNQIYELSKRIEGHKYFLLNYFNLVPSRLKSNYMNYISSLYGSIFRLIDESVVLDSSKYPGRALSLMEFFDKRIYIIYLVRSPARVVESFNKKDVAQRSKGFWSANIYYFIINIFCLLVKLKANKAKFIKVKYEDLLCKPDIVLKDIQEKFNIDFNRSIDMVRNNASFETGFAFNGNRMRLDKDIKLVRNYKKTKWTVKTVIANLLNGMFYL